MLQQFHVVKQHGISENPSTIVQGTVQVAQFLAQAVEFVDCIIDSPVYVSVMMSMKCSKSVGNVLGPSGLGKKDHNDS